MAKSGRKPKGWTPEYTPEKDAVAREFLEWSGRFYQRARKFCEIFSVTDDELDDAILSIYDSLRNNGLPDNGTPRERRFETMLFMSIRHSAGKKNTNEIPSSDGPEPVDNSRTVEDKTESDLWEDFRTYWVLRHVEENYDPVTFNCFRIYYIIPNMTYAKLKALTGVPDCKRRVTECRREICDGMDLKKVRDEFENWLENPEMDINLFIV